MNFKNNYLEMEILSDTKFSVNFLGYTSTYTTSKEHQKEYFESIKKKRIDAYNLVPAGCKIIPAPISKLLDGLFLGGVLEDSIRIVYGLGEFGDGIKGYSCSLFFIPTKEKINKITDYFSLNGDFTIKEIQK